MSEKLEFILKQVNTKIKDREKYSIDHSDHTDYSDEYCIVID